MDNNKPNNNLTATELALLRHARRMQNGNIEMPKKKEAPKKEETPKMEVKPQTTKPVEQKPVKETKPVVKNNTEVKKQDPKVVVKKDEKVVKNEDAKEAPKKENKADKKGLHKPVKAKKKFNKKKKEKKAKVKRARKVRAGVIIFAIAGLIGTALLTGLPQKGYQLLEQKRIERNLEKKKMPTPMETLNNVQNNNDEQVSVIPQEEPQEYIEYISGELIDSDYKFDEGITPEYLKSINPTLSANTAWIEIPGTKIDYQVVLPSTENIDKVPGLREAINKSGMDEETYMNNYYLKHTVAGTSSDWGTLYMDIDNEPLDQHTVLLDDVSAIYGHHMMDGSMFTGLDKYKKDKTGSYYAEHPFGVIYTDDGMCYKMNYIGCVVVSGNDSNNIKVGNFNNIYEKQQFIDNFLAMAKEQGYYTAYDHIDVTEDTKFLETITCSYAHDNDRLVPLWQLEKCAIKDINLPGYEVGKGKGR